MKTPNKVFAVVFSLVAICVTLLFMGSPAAKEIDLDEVVSKNTESAIEHNIQTTPIVKKPIYEISDAFFASPSIEQPSQIELPVVPDPETEEIDFLGKAVYYDVPVSREMQDKIRVICEYYGFEPKLIYQIMYCESGFDANARSSSCLGAMQIHQEYYIYALDTEDGMSTIYKNGFDPFNMEHNVLVGVRILAEKREECREAGYVGIKPILECYNKGTYGFMHQNPTYRYSEIVLAVDIREQQS